MLTAPHPAGDDTTRAGTVLVVGASRGLGLGLTAEYLRRGWSVTATARGEPPADLRELAGGHGDRLRLESVDVTVPEDITALRARMSPGSLDLLFVNAGVTDAGVPVGQVTTDEFVRVMVTNALGPMRVVEALQDLVTVDGTIAVMSSSQGSLTRNTTGGYEVYRASKSALNQLVRSYAARHADDRRTLVLMDPGWVQTGLGGAAAPLTVDQSVPGVVDTLARRAGQGGLLYVDHQDQVVPW